MRNEQGKRILQLTLLLLALGFLALGIIRGENESMWARAVNVCLECIGIG